MSIGTKLILLLTLTVGAVMFFASFLSLRQREAALESALRDELRAHAVTLRIALEENYDDGRVDEARELIDRLRENSRIYVVLLFDEKGNPLEFSGSKIETVFLSPPELEIVLQRAEPVEFIREVNGSRFLSLILPLRFSEERTGALEMIKPLARIEDDIARRRVNWISITLLLLAVIFLVVVVVLSRSLSKPFQALLEGARALGRGDLAYRVNVPKTRDELALLAEEFNRMADNLEEQRRAAETEAENRLALEQKLRHSERLASVGRLAAGIAHEFGAPLNVIDARAEQLLEKPDAPPEKRERNLTIIRRQTKRISRTVRQLLNLSRPYNFRFAPVVINESLVETLEEIGRNLKKSNIEAEFSANGNYTVSADRYFLRQVWLNIFQNASQAMPDGGKLSIECSGTEREDGNFAVVRVSDTGKGIEAEHFDKIFDPFYTTKDIGEGTGLGLAVAHRIIEEHGGAIEAANNAEGGATFSVYLPLANEGKK
ncbi:MAG TPA: ATP-binding protein [Pyrinomonadaceae bacterium]|nr:ATP-binding protein [Pyrinomonadaceae bacterium]